MLLYHATTESIGHKILFDNTIKSNIERQHIYSDCCIDGKNINISSSQGFVYLFDNPLLALTFANSLCFLNNENKICMFEVDIPIDELQPDKDEITIQSIKDKCKYDIGSALSSLEICQCVTVSFDLNLSKYKSRYLILPSTTYGKDTTKEDALNIFNMTKLASQNKYKKTISKDVQFGLDYLFSLNWQAIHS